MKDKNEVIGMKKQFKVPSRIKNYKIEKEINCIDNGHICVGTNININEKVLIKIYDKEIIQYNNEELSLINNEIFMMRLINHRHCLKLYEIIESPSYIFLVTEYFNGIKLDDFINQKKKLSEEDALNIYKQLVSVLVYLHDMNIGHLNINSKNIFIDSSNNIKIFEFKYSAFCSSKNRTKCDSLGDKIFLSPELISKKSCFPELSDIWSSGIILYILAVGEHPFYSQNELDSQKLILKGEFKLPSSMSKMMSDFFKTVFELKEESRYNLERMFNCALFRQNKITKDNLTIGLNVLSAKYPIDQRALTICKNYFNLDQDEIKQKLYDNVFDPETSLYKQIVSKFTTKKVSSDGDLVSKKYSNYVNNEKHYFDEKIQRSNIQKNLNKELDINHVNKEREKDIELTQGDALNRLDELLQSYNEYKKDPQTLKNRPKRNRSVDEAKKQAKMEEKEKMIEKIIEKDKEKENKENISKSINVKQQNKNAMRNSINYGGATDLKSTNLINKNKEKKPDKKYNIKSVNYNRRMSSNVNMDLNSLKKFKNFQLNLIKKKSSMKKKYYNPNQQEIIEESKENIKRKKSSKKNLVAIKEDEEEEFDYFKRNAKRARSVYQKKKSRNIDDKEKDPIQLDNLDIIRKNSRRQTNTSNHKGKNEEEINIVRKASSKKNTNFYLNKSNNKSEEKQKEEIEISRKISEKNTIKTIPKKDDDSNSSNISSSRSFSSEKNDLNNKKEKKIFNFKSNKYLKKVSFQANDFNFLENQDKKTLIDKKPSSKGIDAILKKSSLRYHNDSEKKFKQANLNDKKITFKDNDSLKKKPSLKMNNSTEKKEEEVENKPSLKERENINNEDKENKNSSNKKKESEEKSKDSSSKKEIKNSVIVPKTKKKEDKTPISNNNAKPGMMQISKEEFFNQIKGVKLKKVTPNTYFDPDEIKKKDKKDTTKNSSPSSSVEVVSVSAKSVRQMIEDNIKNSKKNKNTANIRKDKENQIKNINNENKAIKNINEKKEEKKIKNETDLRKIRKQMENKYLNMGMFNNPKTSRGTRNLPRKSVNLNNELMFKNQAIFLNKNDFKKTKSKDDNSYIKYNFDKSDTIFEDDANEVVTPKFKKKSEKEEKRKEDKKKGDDKKAESKRLKEEEKKIKEAEAKRLKEEEEENAQRMKREEENRIKSEEKRKRKEEEKKKKEIEDELRRRKEQEERIQQEIEEEKRRKEIEKKIHENKVKERKGIVDRERKEEEDRQRVKERERAEKLLEEERRQEEEEERKRIEKEKEEEIEKERKKKEAEERRRIKIEEREKRRKEIEEEDKRKEKENRIRKDKEKERKKKEEDEKIKKWKEEARRKRESEEKRKIVEEEKIRKEEEEERKRRREENEMKRLLEEQENNRRLEEYEKKQKEEAEKRKKREELKKQKEEELRQKREKDARERRKTNLKKVAPKKRKTKKEESESDNESEEESEEIQNNSQINKKNTKKKFNYHSNPFDKYKATDSSDEESSSIVVKRTKKKLNKANTNQPKKKPTYKAKFNDFNNFRESDKIISDSESSDSSEEEELNNKSNEKQEMNKSIDPKKNKKNSIYKRFNNYFFDENAINEKKLKNRKSKEIKVEPDKKVVNKGFYHYQNNPKKEEKSIVDKKFELRTRNNATGDNLNNYNTLTENSKDNIKKVKPDKAKKKKHSKQNTNNSNLNNNEKDIISVKFKGGRNKNNELNSKQNNSVAINHETNLTKIENNNGEINTSKLKLNQYKNNAKKLKKDAEKNKVINNYKTQKLNNKTSDNLKTGFDQTIEELSSIYPATSREKSREHEINKSKESNSKPKSNDKSSKTKIIPDSKSKVVSSKVKITSNSKSKSNRNIKNDNKLLRKNNTSEKTQLNHSIMLNNKNKNLNLNSSLKSHHNKNNSSKGIKPKSKASNERNSKSKDKNLTESNIESSNRASKNIIKVKKNNIIKEEDLPLFKGQIDYNNVSVKNIEESINEVKKKYKKNGYTFMEKGKTEFLFIKGPNTHHVTIMRLGNGLLYFHTKK